MLEGQGTVPGVLTLSSHHSSFDYITLLLLLMWKLKPRETWSLLRVCVARLRFSAPTHRRSHRFSVPLCRLMKSLYRLTAIPACLLPAK